MTEGLKKLEAELLGYKQIQRQLIEQKFQELGLFDSSLND